MYANLFRLGSTNLKKDIQALDIFWWGAKGGIVIYQWKSIMSAIHRHHSS